MKNLEGGHVVHSFPSNKGRVAGQSTHLLLIGSKIILLSQKTHCFLVLSKYLGTKQVIQLLSSQKVPAGHWQTLFISVCPPLQSWHSLLVSFQRVSLGQTVHLFPSK